MQKWKFLSEHATASAAGFIRFFCQHPGFALRLLSRRACYFLIRRVGSAFQSPGGFVIDTPDTLIAYWSMFVEGELDDVEWWRALQGQPHPVVVDVGANAGVFSHLVHQINPAAEIICFEPLPEMAERVRRLAASTGMNLVCHQKAVSSRCGEALFERHSGHEGTSRLAAEAGAETGAFKVQTTTLDAELGERPITLLKIDVEGFECEVIAGGAQAIRRSQFLILEAQDAGHLARIQAALGAGWRCKKLGSSDYLFSR